MSRSGYGDYDGDFDGGRYWGAVSRAYSGKRTQKFFKELLHVLETMPEKKLIKGDIVKEGAFCALGAIGHARGIPDLDQLDPYDVDTLSNKFDIALCMVREITYENDTAGLYKETPEQRHERMVAWVKKHINEDKT
jgi:hypothetical protein